MQTPVCVSVSVRVSVSVSVCVCACVRACCVLSSSHKADCHLWLSHNHIVMS